VRAVIRAYVQSSWLRGSRHASQAQGDCHGCPRIRDRPIDAKGAFTSEIDLPLIIKPGPLNTVAEADRPQLVDQPGMRHKYLPLRHDPATGAISTGGRYLFHTYEDATKYRDFLASNATACPMQNSKRACQGCLPRILEAKVFPGEQTTFWKRPFFVNTVRFAWRDWRARSHSDHHTCARLLARRSSRERGHRHILRLTPTHQVPSAGEPTTVSHVTCCTFGNEQFPHADTTGCPGTAASNCKLLREVG
jgi:hypothetical protein